MALVWALGVAATGYILLTLAVLALTLFLRTTPAFSLDRPMTILAIGFTCVVFASLIDIGYGQHLWMSVTSYDHGIRTAFIDAVLHTGVPPANPLYWPGHAAPMRYYYFWYVTCAVVAKLAHISARQVLIAGCVWPFAGVLAMLALYARHLLDWRGIQLRRGWWLAVALLGVTGLDILATIGARVGGDPLYGDMDWWSIDQVASWADSFLWVPHHVAALICCLLTILLLWVATASESRSTRLQLALLAGLSFAGAFGLSTYVALATAIVVVMWLIWRQFFEDRREVLVSAVVAGATAGLLLLPYIGQLLHHANGESAESHGVLTLAVRQMISPSVLTDLPFARGFYTSYPFLATQLAALVLLIPGYVAELGFFLVVLLMMQCPRKQRSAGESALLFWTWCGLAAATFLRSQVIATNDYGIRAMLLPQFFLLLVAVLVFQRSSGWIRNLIVVLAVIGVAGTSYQVMMLRAYLPWHEAHDNGEQGTPMFEMGERNYALRDAYDRLDTLIPATARVQYDPSDDGYFGYSQLLNIHRQMIVDGKTCNASFGGERSACGGIQNVIAQIYREAETSASSAPDRCGRIGVQYLVATRWDAIWRDRASWVWSLPVVLERPNVRIVHCTPPLPQ